MWMRFVPIVIVHTAIVVGGVTGQVNSRMLRYFNFGIGSICVSA